MELEVARQMYELAVRREENRLTAKDKEILALIDIPSSRILVNLYRIALDRNDAINSLNDYVDGRYFRWYDSALHFLEMYYKQKEIGMTNDTDVALCNWALNKRVPIKIIRMITHHSGTWSHKNSLNHKKMETNYG